MRLFAVALTALLICQAASVGEVDRAKTLGNPSAPVRLELFSDFQCPACKAFHDEVLPELMKSYVVPGKAYLVSHEFPLNMHPYSHEAANYATAAAHIGKYQQVVDALFAKQVSWAANGKVWDTVAGVLTLPEQKKVQSLAKEPSIAAEVQQDLDIGKNVQISQTPTLFVVRGAKRYAFPGPGRDNLFLLRGLIDGVLK